MEIVFAVPLLAGCIKMLHVRQKPLPSAVLYALGLLVIELMIQRSFIISMEYAVGRFAFTLGYFALLNYFEDTAYYWGILILGFSIVLVDPFTFSLMRMFMPIDGGGEL